jgi:hypothetical protein
VQEVPSIPLFEYHIESFGCQIPQAGKMVERLVSRLANWQMPFFGSQNIDATEKGESGNFKHKVVTPL